MKSVLLERLTGASGVEMGHICLARVGRLNSDRWFTWFSNAGEGMKHVCVRERAPELGGLITCEKLNM